MQDALASSVKLFMWMAHAESSKTPTATFFHSNFYTISARWACGSILMIQYVVSMDYLIRTGPSMAFKDALKQTLTSS